MNEKIVNIQQRTETCCARTVCTRRTVALVKGETAKNDAPARTQICPTTQGRCADCLFAMPPNTHTRTMLGGTRVEDIPN